MTVKNSQNTISIGHSQSLHLHILANIIINPRSFLLAKFPDPCIEGHTISKIIFHILVLTECLENISNDIFHWLEVHLEDVDVFFVLFYLFFVEVALVHEFVLVLLFDLLFL